MENNEAAFITLSAFVGAIFGGVGLVAAAFSGDASLGMVALIGAAGCLAIWQHHLRC